MTSNYSNIEFYELQKFIFIFSYIMSSCVYCAVYAHLFSTKNIRSCVVYVGI